MFLASHPECSDGVVPRLSARGVLILLVGLTLTVPCQITIQAPPSLELRTARESHPTRRYVVMSKRPPLAQASIGFVRCVLARALHSCGSGTGAAAQKMGVFALALAPAVTFAQLPRALSFASVPAQDQRVREGRGAEEPRSRAAAHRRTSPPAALRIYKGRRIVNRLFVSQTPSFLRERVRWQW